jgi:hypothetical protein
MTRKKELRQWQKKKGNAIANKKRSPRQRPEKKLKAATRKDAQGSDHKRSPQQRPEKVGSGRPEKVGWRWSENKVKNEPERRPHPT